MARASYLSLSELKDVLDAKHPERLTRANRTAIPTAHQRCPQEP